MESLVRQLESRKGKSHENLDKKSNRNSFVKNSINDDNDATDEDICYPGVSRTRVFDNTSNLNPYSDTTNNLTLTRQRDNRKRSKQSSDVVITSCKPCFVMLERLTDGDVQNLLARNNLGSINVKENNKKKRPSGTPKIRLSAKAINQLNLDFKQSKDSRDSKNTARKRPSNPRTRKKPIEVADESRSSRSNQSIDESSLLVNEGKVCSDDSNKNQTFRQDPCSSVSRINDLSKYKVTATSTKNKVLPPRSAGLSLKKKTADTKDIDGPCEQDSCAETSQTERFEELGINDLSKNKLTATSSKNKVLPPRSAGLSLKKKIADTKDIDGPCEQDSCAGTSQTARFEELKDTGINSEDSECVNSLFKKKRRGSIRKKPNPTVDEESCEKDPGGKNLQTEDINDIDGSGFNSNESETKILPPKRFRLSLRKRGTDRKDVKACKQDPCNKISQLEDSDVISESNVLELSRHKHVMKRKLNNTEEEENVHKLKKCEEKQDATSHDCSEVGEPDSLPHNSSVPERSYKSDTLRNREVAGNRHHKRKVDSNARNIAPITKNVRGSLVKLEYTANPSTSEQANNIQASDHCIDIDEPDSGCEIIISENKPKNSGLICSPKTKNTRITDYFFKVDKRSFLSENISKNLSQECRDLALKKKYNICRDANVLLIDLKKFEISGSKYLASEIEKLSQEYTDSFINIDSTSTTANMPSSSLVFSSRNLPCSSNELFSNDNQSSIDSKKLLSVHDHADELAHNLSHTPTVLIAKSQSSKGHKSLQVEKHSPAKSIQGSTIDQQLSADLTNQTDHVGEPSYDALHAHTLLVSENLLPTGQKVPQLKKHSPAKNTQDSLNEEIFVKRSTPRLRKKKESAKSTEHVEDYSLVNADLNVEGVCCREVPEKNTPSQNSSELRPRLRSSVANVNELGNHSADSTIINTTPKKKSLNTLNSQIKKLVLSPGKRMVLINPEIELKESQVHVTDINNKLPKTNKVKEKSDSMTRAEVLEDLPDDNEVQKGTNATWVKNEESNTVIPQPDTHPAFVSVIRSPAKVETSKTNSKQETPRRLPINSMTIISREMIEENSSWIGLPNAIDSVTEESIPTTKNHTRAENESFENTKISCNTTKNSHNSSLENRSPVATIKNTEDASLSKDNRLSTELRDKNPLLRKSLTSKSTANLSSTHPACSIIETFLSEVNASSGNGMQQTKIDNIQHSDTVSEIKTPMLNITSLISKPSVENSIDPISVERIDQECGKSTSQDHLLTNSQQEGQLIIDTDESDSDPQPADDIPPETPSLSSSNIKIGVVVESEETCKETEASSKKECFLCKKSYKSARGLEFHLNEHERLKDGCCLICDKPLIKKNAIEHYLEHYGCSDDGRAGLYACDICDKRFRKKSGLTSHVKAKHNRGKNRRGPKMDSIDPSTNADRYKCGICELPCNSKEDLFSHLYTHTEQEHQDAYKAAEGKKQLPSSSTTIGQNQDSDTSQVEKTPDNEQVLCETTEVTETPQALPVNIQNLEVSICMCHKDERLETTGGVIIEIALACLQCKTFYKSRKCFKDHYNTTSCKSSDKSLLVPKMFCNKCCVILNSLQDMPEHLKSHGEDGVIAKTSLLCKRCNIFFLSSGSLFHTHWSEHRKDPLFIADYNSFPNHMTVKIVEPEGPQSTDEDEPTECLCIADHQCHNCEKPFHTADDLKKHLQLSSSCSEKVDPAPQVTEKPKSNFNLICSICNKEFQNKSTFDTHIEEHDTIRDFLQGPKYSDKSIKNNQLTCSICKTEYDTITNYKQHMITHEVIQEKFLCTYCELMMDSVEDFERHFLQHKGTPEKPVACKVIFATAKFHCKPCKISFNNQSIMDEHLATHSNLPLSNPRSVEVLMTNIMPAIERKNLVCETVQQASILDNHPATHCNLPLSNTISVQDSMTNIVPADEEKNLVCETFQQEFVNQLKLDAHVSKHPENASDHSIADPVLINLSDDSNSTDIEIIPTETNEKSGEPTVGNTLPQDQQETADTQKTKKPAFLRVKNLKELLPYACGKCKAEYDTQVNLDKHVCTPNVNPAQDKEFNYFCRICKIYQCNNDSDWNLHVLSHLPLQSSQKFRDDWYHLLNMPLGQQVFKCNVCQNYTCSSLQTIRRHFMVSHPDIYQPIFKGGVRRTSKTALEETIQRHEAAHFQQLSPLQQLLTSGQNSPSAQPVENSNNQQQPLSIPPVTSSGDNTSLTQPLKDFCNSHQSGSTSPFIRLSNNVSSTSAASQPLDNPTNSQQVVLNPPMTRSDNNVLLLQPLQRLTNSGQPNPTLQPINNFNNVQQVISIPPKNSSGGNLSIFQQTDNSNKIQQPASISPVTSSCNNSPSFQTTQNTNNSQPGPADQPDNNTNHLEQSVPITPITNSNNKLPILKLVNNSNTFQHQVWIPPVVDNSQQPGATRQPNNNSNDLEQSVPISPATNSNSKIPQLQPAENSNTFQQAVWIPSVINSGNNLSLLRLPPNFNSSQQPGQIIQSADNSNMIKPSALIPPVTSPGAQPSRNLNNSRQLNTPLESDNHSNNFQQSISIPPTTNSSINLSSLQPINNPQWLTTTAQTLQIQINNASPFNNMTNVMHAVPLYVTNLIYSCRICKNYKFSSKQELEAHEALHEFMQFGENSKRMYQCKLCTNVFYPTEGHLKTHMDVFHKGEKSNVSQKQTQSNATDTQMRCNHCSQVFSSSCQLMQHIYTSHTFVNQQQNNTQFQNSYKYSCKICSDNFLNEAFLYAHMRQIHPNVKLPRQQLNDTKTLYKCDICGLLLISEATLNYHMRSHNMGYH